MKSDDSDKPGKPGKPARQPTPATLTRRAFIKGAGAAAAAVASLGAVASAEAAGEDAAANSDGVIERLGPGAQAFELNINAQMIQVTAEPRVTRAGGEHHAGGDGGVRQDAPCRRRTRRGRIRAWCR
jgi:hypothetical protein